MLEAETVMIGEMEFQLLPMPCLTARKWDFKILQLLAPLVGALDGLHEDKDAAPEPEPEPEPAEDAEAVEGSEDVVGAQERNGSGLSGTVEFSKIASALIAAMETLSDVQQEQLIAGMFFHVQRIDCRPSIALTTPANINKAFSRQSPSTMYELLYHVARFNKFTPFAVLGTGGRIKGILGSLVPSKIQKGLDLGRLAP